MDQPKLSNKEPNDPSSFENWIDGQVVMQVLHISSRTLLTLRKNGTLPFSRIGSKLYYHKQDILKILSNNYIIYKLHTHENKSKS